VREPEFLGLLREIERVVKIVGAGLLIGPDVRKKLYAEFHFALPRRGLKSSICHSRERIEEPQKYRLQRHCASFETRPPDAPQDEAKLLMARRKLPHPEEPPQAASRRAHAVDPANRQFFHNLFHGGDG
jgi:hypothetical protein